MPRLGAFRPKLFFLLAQIVFGLLEQLEFILNRFGFLGDEVGLILSKVFEFRLRIG